MQCGERTVMAYREKVPAVYILESKRNGTIYTSVSSDLYIRIQQHKQGLIEGFTELVLKCMGPGLSPSARFARRRRRDDEVMGLEFASHGKSGGAQWQLMSCWQSPTPIDAPEWTAPPATPARCPPGAPCRRACGRRQRPGSAP